jgi:hypothetical protein
VPCSNEVVDRFAYHAAKYHAECKQAFVEMRDRKNNHASKQRTS